LHALGRLELIALRYAPVCDHRIKQSPSLANFGRFENHCVGSIASRVHPETSRIESSQQFEKQLMPEDILHLRATSMTIMQDPVCELQSQEVQKYVVKHRDPIGDLPLWHPRRLGT